MCWVEKGSRFFVALGNYDAQAWVLGMPLVEAIYVTLCVLHFSHTN